jgi:hypothetical protein
MGLEIAAQDDQDAHMGVRRLARSLIALPVRYPTLWAIAWTVLILVCCLAPARAFPVDEEKATHKTFPHVDHMVHFALFAGFVASWIRVGRSPLRWVVVPAIGLVLGVGTELAQAIPMINRDPTLSDGMADCFGVLIGLVGFLFVSRLAGRNRPHAP